MSQINRTDVDLVSRIIQVIYDWSGADDETPDDTEVLTTSSGMHAVTLGELKDASSSLEAIRNAILTSKDGQVKFK